MGKEGAPVIVYGGSFDPPHRGHTSLVSAALAQLKPRALYLVPNYRTPFKDLRPVPYSGRAAMLRLALSDAGLSGRPEVSVSDWEARQNRPVYTWETLKHFASAHPGAPLYFLMGSDCLASFPSWREPGRILSSARLLVGLRPGFSSAGTGMPFRPLAGRFPEESSSALRVGLFLGQKPAGAAPAVNDYITEHGLYLSAERRRLKSSLSEKRYRHSLAVAQLAASLAPSLGLPAQAAAVAGMLHDCAREKPVSTLKSLLRANTRAAARVAETAAKAPSLLHAWAAPPLARREYGVKDPAVLEAVALHATGAPDMGLLAKLIYVCDLAGEDRAFPEAAIVRRLARSDFDAAFRAANYVKLSYAFSKGGWVHPLCVDLWNSLLEGKKN